jgi:hypothetical protein
MHICFNFFWIGLIHFWLGIFMHNSIIQWIGIILGGGALTIALGILLLNYVHGKYHT